MGLVADLGRSLPTTSFGGASTELDMVAQMVRGDEESPAFGVIFWWSLDDWTMFPCFHSRNQGDS